MALAEFPDYQNDDRYRPDKKGVLRRWKGSSGAKDLVRRELVNRQTRIDGGGIMDWDTQNTFYYYMRPIFLKNGIDPQHEGKEFRKHVTAYIVEICHELGTTREDLFIYTSERATFYHRGEQFKVSLRSLEELAEKGTDIIIIEKANICDLLAPYSGKAGVALLDTKGFVVEYARRLSGLSQKSGCNVAILTDLDDSGLLMARKVMDEIPDVYRIGIELQTIKELADMDAKLKPKLHLKDIEEQYAPGTAYMRLEDMGPSDCEDAETFEENLAYVSGKRIEIDSVKRAIGTENLWKYLKIKLFQEFPERDYNRSMVVYDIVYPSLYWELKKLLEEKMKQFLVYDVEAFKDELATYEGIIDDVEAEENRIEGELVEVADEGETVEPIRKILQPVINKLKKLKVD